MPKSRKPTETKMASATKKAVVAKVATEAAKAASGSSMTKKTSQTVDNKTETAPAAVKKASGPKATSSHRDAPVTIPDAGDEDVRSPTFLADQRVLLHEERASYTKQAEELKAQADSLALEHEPGDVQFDEEGGEGGTSNVDRELDLVLSGQARAAIAEIDRALGKIDIGTYGICEQCGRDIPPARLQALPYAALCVACKSGGLSRRS